MRAACGSSAQSQLTVEDVFWNATILHTADMTQPSQSALSKQSVHTGKTNTRQDITVGYFVLPGYSQDTADASQVELVEPSLLPGICCPCLAAIQQCALPGHGVDVDSLHVSYADIFVSKVRAACGSSAQSQLTVEDVFWNATILHTAAMTQPSQSALSKQSVHTGKTSTRQDITVGYFFLPGYSQDTADAFQVELVEPSLLPGICSPCLAAMQQCADNTGVVDCHLCLHGQLGACPHSSRETGES